ncbi:MAG: hypothetical protein IPL10_15260 [Bacteroidetes bacterium]|nr:hypothetical protein [Bacteroidota bacterium]
MKSLFVILLKNIILLTLITISLVFMFTQHIGFKKFGICFRFKYFICVIIVHEAYALSQVKKETKKFIYFTDGFLANVLLK